MATMCILSHQSNNSIKRNIGQKAKNTRLKSNMFCQIHLSVQKHSSVHNRFQRNTWSTQWESLRSMKLKLSNYAEKFEFSVNVWIISKIESLFQCKVHMQRKNGKQSWPTMTSNMINVSILVLNQQRFKCINKENFPLNPIV